MQFLLQFSAEIEMIEEKKLIIIACISIYFESEREGSLELIF